MPRTTAISVIAGGADPGIVALGFAPYSNPGVGAPGYIPPICSALKAELT